jgi:hypothetical protein
MGRIVRLTERDLTRLVRRVIREQEIENTASSTKKGLTPLAQGLKKVIDGLPSNPGVAGIRRITTYCKGRTDAKWNDSIGRINDMINDALSGLSNPLNLMGGGSIDKVANIFIDHVKTPEQACSVIKSFQTETNLADVALGPLGNQGGGDFYDGIWGDSKFKLNTAQPANKIIGAISRTIPDDGVY